ncbi:MAG: hypothetical protein ACH36H_08015 [Candidatus Nanopelagicales bacterium]
MRRLLLGLLAVVLAGLSGFAATGPAAAAGQAFPSLDTPAPQASARDIPVPAGTKVAVHTGRANAVVFGNLTATGERGAGHLTAGSCGLARPAVSNVNYVTGVTRPNFIVVKTDASGDFCVWTSTAAHILFDLSGTSGALATGTPTRLLDSRSSTPVPAGGIVRIPTGVAANATVMGTLTVVAPTGAGHTTAWPCDQPRPTTSVNNFTVGQTSANFALVGTDSSGAFCVYTTAATHLLWDQAAATTAIPSIPGRRVVDTRTPGSAPIGTGGVLRVHTGAAGGSTVAGNLTVTQPAGPGFTTAWPCDQSRPTTSVNNFTTGQTTANFTAVRTDASGDFCVYSSMATHALFDLAATNGLVGVTPVRQIDSRTMAVPRHPKTGQDFYPTVTRWAPTVLSVLDGKGINDDYLPGILAQIQQESSGVPDAVNGWDSNWSAGVASWGLLQLIAPTYQANAKPGFAGTIETRYVNGVAQKFVSYMIVPEYNIWAAMTYVQRRYGNAKFDTWNSGVNAAYGPSR